MQYSLIIFADYFQIYLEDENTQIDVSASWTPAALHHLLAFDPNEDGGFAMGTVRNMLVPLEIELLPKEPQSDDLDRWDHVNECSIRLPSGVLVVYGCTGYRPEAMRIIVNPDIYRARLYYGKLNTLHENGLDGDDHYRVVLWTSPFDQPKTLKQRDLTFR